MRAYLEHHDGKFWEIRVEGASHTVRFGKLGTGGQQRTKPFESEAAAKKDAERLICSKEKKGYARVDGGARPPAPDAAALQTEALQAEAQALVAAFRARADAVGWEHAVRPPATPEQIAGLEARWGRALPPSYRALLEFTNGIDGYGPMRLLGTEDQDWAAEQIAGLVEHWDVPDVDDEDADYDPDTFRTQYPLVLVPEGGLGIHNFYTFERSDEPELKVVGWEYGAKEEPRSFFELLEEEGDLPEPEAPPEPPRERPREVSLDEALAALASGELPAEGPVRAKALGVFFEPGYFVDQPEGALARAGKTVLASEPTDDERAKWLSRMPAAVEHVDLFIGPEPPADDLLWYRKIEQYLARFWEHPEAERWADVVRPYAAADEHLGHTLARIYARAGRLEDALQMCAEAVKAGPQHAAQVFEDPQLAALGEDERFRRLFRTPPGSEPIPSYFGPYEVAIDVAAELPPLLGRFFAWLQLQPMYSLGWFTKAEVRPFSEPKKKPAVADELTQLIAFHSKDEIALEKECVLALCRDGDALRVVLVWGKDCWEIDSTVEGFLRRWASATTGVSPLDQDGRRTIRYKKQDATPRVASRRALLGLWLDDEGVPAEPATAPPKLPKGVRPRPRELPPLPEDDGLLRAAAADRWEWDEELRRQVNAGEGMRAYGEWLKAEGHPVGELALADLAAEREPRKKRAAKNLAQKLFANHVASTFAGPLAAIAHEMTHFLAGKYYFSLRYGYLEALDVWDCGPRMVAQALALLQSPYGRLVRKLSLRDRPIEVDELARLPALRSCRFTSSRHVRDLTPLAGLRHLSSLGLGPTQVTDLSPLAGLPLEELSIGPAGVPLDLAPLAEHPTLTSIDLGGTPIASARPLLSCPGLKKVGLWGTKVDLGELRQLKDCLEARGGRLSHHRPEF